MDNVVQNVTSNSTIGSNAEDSNISINHEDGDESLDRTTFLLARLQELRAWQHDQELRLLQEQEEQMDRLANPGIQPALSPVNIDGNDLALKATEGSFGSLNNENVAWTDIRNNIRKGKTLYVRLSRAVNVKSHKN